MADVALEKELRTAGRASYDESDFDEAARLFKAAAAVHPKRPWAWLWLARAELKRGNHEAAMEAITTALEVEPGQPLAVRFLADLHRDAGRPEDAARVLVEAVEQHPDPELLAMAATRLGRLGQHRLAVEFANRVLGTSPSDEESLVTRATSAAAVGDRGFAEALFAEADGSSDQVAVRAAIRVAVELADVELVEKLMANMDDAGAGSVVLSRAGHLLRRCGDLPAASRIFERALNVDPNHPATSRWHEVIQGEIALLSGAWGARSTKRGAVASEKGRVLHLVGRSLPHTQSGYTLRTHSIAQAQRAAGIDAGVVTQLGFPWTDGVTDAATEDAVGGICYHRLWPQAELPVRADDRLSLNVNELGAVIRSKRPALLHAASDFRNGLLGLEAGVVFEIPVVYEVRGFWEETWLSKQDRESADSSAYRWRRERELECMLRADRLVTLSEGMKSEIVARGVPGEKITVIPNAVDLESFYPVPPDEALRAELGMPPDEVVIGYVSSFVGYEGIRYLIEAVAILRSQGYRVRALLVGDGDERPALEEVARDLDVVNGVTFTGRVPHARVLDHYGLIDIFVVPRTDDRVCRLVTPLKPYEAMATARPVVVSGVGALQEMVVSGETGLVFRPEDAEDLARVVEPLLVDPQARRDLGAAAKEWVTRNRTWSHNGLLYRRLYEEMGVA